MKQQQDLDLVGEAAVVGHLKVVVVVAVAEQQAGHLYESGEVVEVAAEGHLVRQVFCLEVAVAAVGQEPKESDYELVEGAGVAGVRLVGALLVSEVVAERSQQGEGVAEALEALEGQLPKMVTRFPLLVATETGERRGAGLFSDLVAEAA